ncbi:MAG: 30S ribosomal protein S9 [Candidatus Pacearchaeota archaeon]
MDRIVTSGKRKRAVARAVAKKGTGIITINKKNYENLKFLEKLKIEEPLRISKDVLGKDNFDFDISISVKGGGSVSQIEAARLSLARAIIAFTKNKDIEKSFTGYDRNLLVADVRRKEGYKPGDSKARSKRQSSKR